jgi:hypothetical protein
MRLLVEIAEGDGIGEQLIQLLSHFETHRFFKLERDHGGDAAKGLDLPGRLMEVGLRGNFAGVIGDWFLSHILSCYSGFWASR